MTIAKDHIAIAMHQAEQPGGERPGRREQIAAAVAAAGRRAEGRRALAQKDRLRRFCAGYAYLGDAITLSCLALTAMAVVGGGFDPVRIGLVLLMMCAFSLSAVSFNDVFSPRLNDQAAPWAPCVSYGLLGVRRRYCGGDVRAGGPGCGRRWPR